MRQPLHRPAARACGSVLALLLASGCLTRGMDIPITTRIPAEIYLGYMRVATSVGAANPDLPEGMTDTVVAELETTLVGIDVDTNGDVYLAVTDRQRAGVSDNRFKPYWLLDDLAAEHVDDRRAYIEKWAGLGKDPLSWYTTEADAVVRLRDADGDGIPEQRATLAEFRDVVDGIGSAVLVNDGDVWFTDIPHLWRLRDDDDDGVAELRESVAYGFGVTTSLAGHDLHGLTWGPDGRLYFSVGDRGYDVETREGARLRPPMVVSRGAVFRMWPDGSGLEVFATGLRNPQDLVFDDFGNLFTGDNNGDGVDEARLVYVMEGSDSGWAMPVQSMEGEYLHGPWEAERLWETHHPGRPAWALPPIGYIGRGPAGAAMDPGLGGLPDALQGKVLICDYQYGAVRSGVRAYGVTPVGAGFELSSEDTLFGSIIPTDIVFGPEGRIWVSEFDQFGMAARLHRIEDPEHVARPEVRELAALLREGFGDRDADALAALLGHPDRRARRGAQHELAARGDAERLGAVARDRDAPLLARIHALWGLGQLGSEGLRDAGLKNLQFTLDEEPELRAQALRIAGEARAEWLIPDLISALIPGETPRVQSLALTALGRMRAKAALGTIMALVRRNDDRDPWLRHAAVHALAQMDDVDAILDFADDGSPAVRRAVLLVLRAHEDARIARYLADADPTISVEAARAIHDLDLRDALSPLALLGEADGGRLPVLGDDPQTSLALHRRVISANLTLGRSVNAQMLALYAADERNPDAMREAALDALAEFTRPGPREPVFGFHRILPPRSEEVVEDAMAALVPALVGGPYEARVLEIALSYGRVHLPDADLMERLEGWFVDPSVKVASLRVLGERRSPELERALELGLDSRHPELRAEARDVLVELRPDEAVASVLAVPGKAPLVERQRAQATLAAAENEAGDAALRASLESLVAGELDAEIALDVVEAARRRKPALDDALAVYDRQFAASDVIGPRRIALEGGNADRGRVVFEGPGDCLRCHGAGGHGGGAGPELRGVGDRRSRDELLESLVDPGAVVVPGFATVSLVLKDGESFVGTLVAEDDDSLTLDSGGERRVVARADVVSEGARSSAMPPMGLALPLADLRDLIAYLAEL